MDISIARRLNRRRKYLGAVLERNPALAMGFDLPFVVVTATSLKNAVAISFELMVIHFFTMLVAMAACRLLSPLPRAMVNAAAATVAMVVARALIVQVYPEIASSVGIYVYLMAMNGLTVYHANTLDKRMKLWPVLSNAVTCVLLFASTMLVVSAVREYFGNATLWGVAMPSAFKISGLLVPFSGFIVAGILMALVKRTNRSMRGYRISEIQREQKRYTAL